MWFLFYDENGEIVIDTESSKQPRKFVFIEGTKAVIQYFVFGMHLESGLKVKAINKTHNHIVEVRKFIKVIENFTFEECSNALKTRSKSELN